LTTRKGTRLSLHRETVRELNSDELTSAAGGQPQSLNVQCLQDASLMATYCCTGNYPSLGPGACTTVK
jgi:hypothetical protein